MDVIPGERTPGLRLRRERGSLCAPGPPAGASLKRSPSPPAPLAPRRLPLELLRLVLLRFAFTSAGVVAGRCFSFGSGPSQPGKGRPFSV